MAPKLSDQAATTLFLHMLAAERGRAQNTLAAYARDLDDLSSHLTQTKRTVANATTDDLRGYLATLGR